MNNVIEIKNLNFEYSKSKKVLKDINLTIEKGKFVGLIGPNGGGKSTLLKIILGILKPTSGYVKVFGLSPFSLKAREKIGYVPQKVLIHKDFPATVYDVILMGVYNKGNLKYYKEKIYHYANVFSLKDIINSPISEISGGQLQRVLLARALLKKPELLILDEPLTGIDSSGQRIFFEFIRKLKKEASITIFMSSHYIDTLKAQADHLVCLNKVIHFCNSANLITSQLIKHTYECELETFFHNRDYHILYPDAEKCDKKEDFNNLF